jgi:hypothetical protein
MGDWAIGWFLNCLRTAYLGHVNIHANQTVPKTTLATAVGIVSESQRTNRINKETSVAPATTK